MKVWQGKCSTFGGPADKGVAPDEGLALADRRDLVRPYWRDFFLQKQPTGTTGLARRLDPEAFYVACRWNYGRTPRAWLRANPVVVEFRREKNGPLVFALAQPIDWGPHVRTGRVADLSPGLARFLGCRTDDVVTVRVPEPGDEQLANA